MKKLLFLLLLSPLSQADIEREFVLTCKITDQVLLGTEEGLPKRYTGYQDGTKVGDEIRIVFQFNQQAFVYPIYDLRIMSDKLQLFNILSSTYSREDYDGLEYTWNDREYSLSADTIYLQNYGDVRLRLNRYYKNDWQFIWTSGARIDISSFIITANCMNMPSEWDEVLAIIKDTDKDKWAKKEPVMIPLETKPDPFKD